MPVVTPEERWRLLSSALADRNGRGWETRKNAAFFAMTIARELRQYIGAPEQFRAFADADTPQPVEFFSYIEGSAPLYDRFEEADSAMSAISGSDGGFAAFGIGVTLEISPTTLPRCSVHWLIRINTVDPKMWICELRMTRVYQFNLPNDDGRVDVSQVVKACFEELLEWLRLANRPQQAGQRIGFDISRS